MKSFSHTSHIVLIEDKAELPHLHAGLLEAAIAAIDSAYAPYSRFKVGAAVLLENNEIISGSNQENSAYPSGLCAERVAVFSAVTRYPEKSLQAIAVYAPGILEEDGMVSPCGACRQVLYEYEQRQEAPIVVYLMGISKKPWRLQGVRDLLPFPFSWKGPGAE